MSTTLNPPHLNSCIRFLLAVVLVLFSGVSCQHETGTSTFLIRRHTWWNYYDRALAYARLADWGNAQSDLEVALGRRPGAVYPNTEEKRRAKTYGLHFLEDYFPHRELGIVLYHRGAYADAEAELEKSLSMLPSSRATYYLNKARQALLQQAQLDLDGKPEILLDMPELSVIPSPTLLLKGRISSPAFVSCVSINNQPLFIELAQADMDLNRTVYLRPGRHRLSVEAEDLAGRTACIERQVVVDTQGPILSFFRTSQAEENELSVRVQDNFQLQEFSINGKKVQISKEQSRTGITVPLGVKKDETIVLDAVDAAGNHTVARYIPEDLLQAALCTQNRFSQLAATAGYLPVDRQNDKSAGWLPAERKVFAAVQRSKEEDNMPPRVKLFPPIEGRLTVTTEFYLLDLQMEDSSGLQQVVFTVNKNHETRRLSRPIANFQRLTQTLELKPGANQVIIAVQDAKGNVRKKEFIIERKTDCLWREDLRMTCQVLPPVQRDRSIPCSANDLHALLMENLLESPCRLQLVERDPSVIQRLLLELKLNQTDLVDIRRTMAKGKLRPAEWLLYCYIRAWPEPSNAELVVRLVDVSTGEDILTTDIHFAETGREYVRFQLHGLTAKLKQLLPRISTPVHKVLQNGILLKVGSQDAIRPGMRFVFINKNAEQPRYADPMTCAEEWIQARVSNVESNSCRLELLQPEGLSQINQQDIAILR